MLTKQLQLFFQVIQMFYCIKSVEFVISEWQKMVLAENTCVLYQVHAEKSRKKITSLERLTVKDSDSQPVGLDASSG